MTLLTANLRILATTIDDDAAIDSCVVVAIDVHFAGTTSEASARIVDGLLLCIGRCKRWLDTRSLECDPPHAPSQSNGVTTNSLTITGVRLVTSPGSPSSSACE